MITNVNVVLLPSKSSHLRLFWRPPSSPPLHLVASRECGDTASLLQLAPEVSCDWWTLVPILASDWLRLVTILASDWLRLVPILISDWSCCRRRLWRRAATSLLCPWCPCC